MTGRNVTHYQILEKLGEGGMGIVYKALDVKLDRFVALKFLPPQLSIDREDTDRFIHEAKTASSLDHPNICTIHEIDQTDDNQLFVAMTCYEGETLKEKIRSGSINLQEAVYIAVSIARGLSKAHEQGITHRDIKPSNIFITNDNRVKIIDFGLAKLTGRTSLTKEGSTLGTVNYMSPEQAKGAKVDYRTDIWSLGVVLYEMVTGQRPFEADFDQAVLYSIINQEQGSLSDLREDIPQELENIVKKCLAKNPEDRYQKAEDLITDLTILSDDNITSPSSKKITTGIKKQISRKKFYIPAGIITVAILLFFALRPVFFNGPAVAVEPKPIAVIAFANQTGDHSYDYLREAIPNLLITNLEQSKYLRVMTWERMKDVLKQMGKNNEGYIDKDLGFELCRREGINTIVIGSFVKAGNIFATDAKVMDVGSKELIKTVSARGEGIQSILNEQIDKLSREISRGVGLTRKNIAEASSQISRVTTSSMDAYNFFLRGREDYEKLYFQEAQRSFEKAVSLDSNFAIAYLYLSNTYGDLIELPKMTKAILKAKAVSNRAPEKERLAIDSRYASVIEKKPEKSLRLLQELVKKYPLEKRFHDQLGQFYQHAGMISDAQSEFEKAIKLDPEFASPNNGLAYIYADKGLYDKAIETLKHYAALSPGDANPFDSMGEMYLRQGNLQEAISKYKDAIKAQPTFYPAYRSLAYVLALDENYSGCLKWLDSMVTTVSTVGLKAEARSWKACYLSLVGRNRESRHELDLMSDLVNQMGIKETSASYHWVRAWEEMDRGALINASKEFEAFQKIFSRNNPQNPILNKAISCYFNVNLNLKRGNIDSARLGFEKMRPSIKSIEWFRDVFKTMCGVLESELLLAEGRPDAAIFVYRKTPVTKPYMLGGWQMPLYNLPSLRDVVPRAFIFKGEFENAIQEYKKLLKINPSDMDRRLINPLFHYRLAKLYDRTGKYKLAVLEYKRFIYLWKDADKNRPELIDAHKKLALLSAKI